MSYNALGSSLGILLSATASPGGLFSVIFLLFSIGSPQRTDQLKKPDSSCYFYPEAADSKSDKRIDGGSGPEREKSGRKSQSVCNKISIHKGSGAGVGGGLGAGLDRKQSNEL